MQTTEPNGVVASDPNYSPQQDHGSWRAISEVLSGYDAGGLHRAEHEGNESISLSEQMTVSCLSLAQFGGVVPAVSAGERDVCTTCEELSSLAA